MTTLKRQFHHHDSHGDEDWYYLAKDSETGKVWVQHEWEHRGRPAGMDEINLCEFLTAPTQGTKQNRLLALIATLVPDED